MEVAEDLLALVAREARKGRPTENFLFLFLCFLLSSVLQVLGFRSQVR